MSGFLDAIAKIEEKAREHNSDPENEYVGEDGLIYCKKCRTRKQMRVELKGDSNEALVITPYVPCKCRRAEIDKEEAERKERERQERLARMKRVSGIPSLYESASFDTFQKNASNSSIFRMAKNYADKFDKMLELGKGLLMHGTVGTGKTYTAACIGNALLNAGYSVFMTSTYEMLRLRKDDDESQYSDRLLGCSLLIIDDLGAERTTDFGRERVFAYVDGRCSTGKPMILTTNLDFQKMLKPETQEESRIYDRILKRCFPIAFIGESWRRTEARDNFAEMKEILEGGS